jgi:DNA-binding IclR family transcriptional regulator
MLKQGGNSPYGTLTLIVIRNIEYRMARSSPGVQRVAAILNFIVDHPGQAFTLTDLVKALKLSRATCHALLTGLVDVGYLYRTSDKNYMLGPALASIGRIALQHASPLQVAQPEMRALADACDAICAAYFREGEEIVVRDRAASLSHVGWSTPAGTRLKLRAPFGSIYYAWRPIAEAEAWLDACQPAPTPEHRESMMKGMSFLRENGYSAHVRNPHATRLDRAPEQVFREESAEFPALLLPAVEDDAQYQLISVIAPVFELRGHVAFVIGLSGFSETMQGKDIKQIAQRLLGACGRISNFITGQSEFRAA